MKVLYISPGYTPHDRRFLKAFSLNGYNTSYLVAGNSISETRPLPYGITKIPIQKEILCNDYWIEKEFPGKVKSIIEEINPDVVLAGPVQSVSYPVANAGCNTLISMSWGTDILVEAYKTDNMQKRTKYALEKSKGFLCDCESVRKKAFSFAPSLNEWTACFPWGIEYEEMETFQPSDLRSSLGWENMTVFISTRSFEPVYSIETLIYSFAELVHKRAECRLILAGTGSQEDSINKLIKKLSIDQYIKMIGRISSNDLKKYYGSSDIYVSTALSDGTSVSLLEAMYIGLPLIVSNCAGNREWVEHGINGWLAKPGDSLSFYDAMLMACEQRDIWLSMSEINRSIVYRRADWKKNITLLFNLFEKVAKEQIGV